MNIKRSETEITSCMPIKEVAKRTGISVDTVRRLIKAKDLPGAKVGKLWFVRELDLREWLKEKFGE